MPQATVRIREERQIRACTTVPPMKIVRGHWEVQTYTLCDGWVNCWHVEQDGESRLETFATKQDAEKALKEYIADCVLDYENLDDVPAFDDHAIVFVEA